MPAFHAAVVSRRKAALWMACGLAAPAWAAGSAAPPPVANAEAAAVVPAHADVHAGERLRDFDIPAQALAAALNQYGAVADQPAIFVSNMVAGRRSSAVQGRYSPEAGLRLLLAGTGLSFEKISSDLGTTFLLTEGDKPVGRVTLSAFYSLRNYPGLIQARIQDTLCADPLTVPGQFDTLFRFRLDGEGRLHDAVLLEPTGSARRDVALLAALPRVNIGVPPPPAIVEQTLTMRLKVSGHIDPACTQQQAREARP